MRGKNLTISLLLSMAILGGGSSYAAAQIIIEPLFEYPAPPEDMEGLQERSDYLMNHFWDVFDFSRTGAVDQNALNDAFNVYTTAMRYAERGVALSSVNTLLKRLKGNPVLLLQFTKAAEEYLYGPRATIWSDEVYIPFLKALISDKGVSEARKQRYKMHLDVLQRNAPGMKFPEIRLTLKDGRHTDFKPQSPVTIVEFGNPDCDDCRFSKLKLEMAHDVATWIENGEVGMAFIVADAVPEDQADILAQLKDYPSQWIAGICYGGDDIFDIRSTPSFYLIDRNGKIIAKNLDVTQAVDMIRDIKENSK